MALLQWFSEDELHRPPVVALSLSQMASSRQFLCISGGQLGLWVGISAITMCELLDLAAQIIIYLCAKERRKKVPRDVDGSEAPLGNNPDNENSHKKTDLITTKI